MRPLDGGCPAHRFTRLAQGKNHVSIAEFQQIPELGCNPFIPRIFQLFDKNGDNTLSLDEFTAAVTYFGSLTNEEEHYRFAFAIYDLDGDGFISTAELYQTLQMLMGGTYTDAQLEQVVHNTMMEFDRDNDQRLSLEEFKVLLSRTDLQQKFALRL